MTFNMNGFPPHVKKTSKKSDSPEAKAGAKQARVDYKAGFDAETPLNATDAWKSAYDAQSVKLRGNVQD